MQYPKLLLPIFWFATHGICYGKPADQTMVTTTRPGNSQITPRAEKHPCSWQGADPDQGMTEDVCICGTRTVPLLTRPSAAAITESCDYKKVPGPSATDPEVIPTSTYTQGCEVCTLVGGIADLADCSRGSFCPNVQVWLSNNTIRIGNLENDPAQLRETVLKGLDAKCSREDLKCDTTTSFQITGDDVLPGTINEVEELGVKFTIEDNYAKSVTDMGRLLAVGVAAWEKAASHNCQDIKYELRENADASCPKGPVKRDGLTWHLTKREPVECQDCEGGGGEGMPEQLCGYTARVCSAPNLISKSLLPKLWECH